MVSKWDLRRDEELLGAIREGGHDAFSELVKRHGKRFYGVAYRMLFNKDDAEDIVQEAFLKIWEKPTLFREGKGVKFTTWFYRVVTNLCIDLNRKKRPMLIKGENYPAREGLMQDEIMERLNEKDLIDRLIMELPERQQLALTLCFFEGLSNREASEIMGVKLKALQSLLMRAKITLKKRVKANGVGE
jgi:RNA polymerase sigma-70 factor (ECF subfamily)